MNNLLGIPFVNGGRDLKGLDCWGLFVLAMKKFGHDIPDYKILAFEIEKIAVNFDSVINQWEKCEKPDEGLAVSFAINPKFPKVTQHFGVCLSKYKFLHTRTKTGSIIERLDSPYWSKKVSGFWKWQG